MEDDIIKDFIAGLDFELPEKGLLPPEEEEIIDDIYELPGTVIKITFDMVLFMNHSKIKYYMISSNQKMQEIGEMSLKDTLSKYGGKSPRNRRGKG